MTPQIIAAAAILNKYLELHSLTISRVYASRAESSHTIILNTKMRNSIEFQLVFAPLNVD